MQAHAPEEPGRGLPDGAALVPAQEVELPQQDDQGHQRARQGTSDQRSHAKTADTLTEVLLLISVLTLIVSGVGIMNIMLATVNARIREIGVRKAVGATNSEIRAQFMVEAILISLAGGVVGIVLGLALPLSVRFITNYRVPISGWSVIIAVLVSSLVGVLFGTAPAARAAHFDPIESLRYQ